MIKMPSRHNTSFEARKCLDVHCPWDVRNSMRIGQGLEGHGNSVYVPILIREASTILTGIAQSIRLLPDRQLADQALSCRRQSRRHIWEAAPCSGAALRLVVNIATHFADASARNSADAPRCFQTGLVVADFQAEACPKQDATGNQLFTIANAC